MQLQQWLLYLLSNEKERDDCDLSKKKLPFNVKSSIICEQGQGRQVNQDMCYKQTVAVKGDIKAVYAVADGIGSFASSQTASAIVKDILEEWFQSALESGRLDESPDDLSQDVIENVYYRAYDEIVSEARKNHCHMGTTLSMIVVTNMSYHLFHVGDSRIYLYACDDSGESELVRLTNDDKKVDQRDGRSKLVNAIADQLPKPKVAYATEELYDGDMYLLMTDGGYKRNADNQMHQILDRAYVSDKPCANANNELYQHALQNGETDDITILTVLFEEIE